MTTSLIIGTWHEPADREFTHCPSYYAADTETLKVPAGDYDARMTFEGGYTVPMPQWLLVGITTERVSGRLFSGVGGVNYSSTELPKGVAVRHTIQMHRYQIGNLVREGRLTLKPGFEWLNGGAGDAVWQHPDAPQTWADVKRLSDQTCGA